MRVLGLALPLLLLAAPVRADDGDEKRSATKGAFGVGLILGEPTGIDAKLYLRDDQAIQGAVGFAFAGGGVQVHADYVFHPLILQQRPSFVLPLYIGPGLRFIDYTGSKDGSSVGVGLRGVVGMLFDFKNVPLDAFVEVAGVLGYHFKDGDGWGPDFNVGAGVRYYF
ncbi:MAG TPA: hypothetical protein VGM88_19270 [Kofleriaceae bacterium]|jgi:hypothetical protein